MGKVHAVCISKEKGTAKENVFQAEFIKEHGLKDDAHAGNWHRQVSLLSKEKFDEFKSRGVDISYGAFGENLLVEGFDFKSYPVGTIFKCGDVVLKVTQIGKKCHSECEIFHQVGDCIMPREGIFARVLHGGVIKVGDELKLITKIPYKAGVITCSDKSSRGEREDLSGPICKELLEEAGYEVLETLIVPDDEDKIYNEIIRLSDEVKCDVIFTNGGTGFSERDNTPEATLKASTKLVPGIAEAIRYNSLKITDRAMLSRATSVMRNKTLIINLPGSPKAVRECLDYVLDSLSHGIKIMRGEENECARS